MIRTLNSIRSRHSGDHLEMPASAHIDLLSSINPWVFTRSVSSCAFSFLFGGGSFRFINLRFILRVAERFYRLGCSLIGRRLRILYLGCLMDRRLIDGSCRLGLLFPNRGWVGRRRVTVPVRRVLGGPYKGALGPACS